MRPWLARALLCLALITPLASRAQTADVIVFAAASLKNALDSIAAELQRQTGKRVAISYGASLRARAAGRAGSAGRSLYLGRSRLDGLSRSAEAHPREQQTKSRWQPSRADCPCRQGAVDRAKAGRTRACDRRRSARAANVAAVPAGKYGKAALEHFGLWNEVSGKLAQAENVRAALTFVARGEAPLGIVYETDAKADPKVSIVARFPRQVIRASSIRLR